MEVLISKEAEKQLNSLPKEIQAKIRSAFLLLRDGDSISNLEIKKLRGVKNHYRLRIGKYRIRFELEKPDIIKIYWVGKRSQAYRD